jgi:hypothetical protein
VAERSLNDCERSLNDDERSLNVAERSPNDCGRSPNVAERSPNDGGRSLNVAERSPNDGGRSLHVAERSLNDGERSLHVAERSLNDGERSLVQCEQSYCTPQPCDQYPNEPNHPTLGLITTALGVVIGGLRSPNPTPHPLKGTPAWHGLRVLCKSKFSYTAGLMAEHHLWLRSLEVVCERTDCNHPSLQSNTFSDRTVVVSGSVVRMN